MYRDLARHLRKNMTEAERCLWRELRYRQIAGCKFRRQPPIGPYIADFVCFEKKLIIELDGGQHAEQIAEDATRTAWFIGQGFTVVRFWNHQVLEELDSVLEAIWRVVTSPHPNPPPQGGREKDTPHPNPPPQGGREKKALPPGGGGLGWGGEEERYVPEHQS